MKNSNFKPSVPVREISFPFFFFYVLLSYDIRFWEKWGATWSVICNLRYQSKHENEPILAVFGPNLQPQGAFSDHVVMDLPYLIFHEEFKKLYKKIFPPHIFRKKTWKNQNTQNKSPFFFVFQSGVFLLSINMRVIKISF